MSYKLFMSYKCRINVAGEMFEIEVKMPGCMEK